MSVDEFLGSPFSVLALSGTVLFTLLVCFVIVLALSGTVLLALLVHFIIVRCFLIPMDFLDGCISFFELLPTYNLFSHQVLIHPFIESTTCSLRHIFASSPLVHEENSLAGLCLPEHYISSVVWRIGQSIRALRSFGVIGFCVLFASVPPISAWCQLFMFLVLSVP